MEAAVKAKTKVNATNRVGKCKKSDLHPALEKIKEREIPKTESPKDPLTDPFYEMYFLFFADREKERRKEANAMTENERQEQERLEELLPEVDYKDKKLWTLTLGKVIRYTILGLSSVAVIIGFFMLVLFILFGIDGDTYSSHMGLWSLLVLAVGGIGILFSSFDGGSYYDA